MKHLTLKNPIVLIAVLAISMFSVSCGSSPKDEDIQASVNKIIKADNKLKGVTADVKDGVLTLTGECKGQNCDSLVNAQVKGIEGVKEVKNNLTMDTSTDLTLRTSVQSVISKYEGVQADVAGGIVVLRGTIDKKQLEPLMNELKALNLKKLDNQLALK